MKTTTTEETVKCENCQVQEKELTQQVNGYQLCNACYNENWEMYSGKSE